MPLFTPEDRHLFSVASELSVANPFAPERKKLEKRALGDDHVPDADVWSLRGDPRAREENLRRIERILEQRLTRIHPALRAATNPGPEALQLYEEAALFHLYQRYSDPLLELSLSAEPEPTAPWYARFADEFAHWMAPVSARRAPTFAAPHLFALFFQLRRAFVYIFEHLVGASKPAVRLRASVWESVFTHDPRRYAQRLTGRMRDFSTLIMGPTGSGKELVARAIGSSQYRSFDPRTQRFRAAAHLPLNLSALSSTLIESELFGHKKGSFTGATQDHAGWLEVVGPEGVVFLDEIGELDQALQVKLLRVLQTRIFQRIGESEDRQFQGKIIAATNRSLGQAIEDGRFRGDLYYRLCSDLIVTPSLAEQLTDAPGELPEMLRFVVQRILGGAADDPAVSAATEEVLTAVREELPRGYGWPGNFRELEQCARSVLLHGRYAPAIRAAPPAISGPRWAPPDSDVIASLDEVLVRYVSWVFAMTGSYVEAARTLGVDRRTVKAKVDKRLVTTWRGEGRGAGSPRTAPPKP
ncbi:MAG: sigma 54-interacting transcriptional regulator [Myxococcota bacterium]